jgi:hypothetical protein
MALMSTTKTEVGALLFDHVGLVLDRILLAVLRGLPAMVTFETPI